MCASPYQHTRNINQVYADKYGCTLLKVLQTELSGAVGGATLFLVEMDLTPAVAIAKLIDQAMAGFGMNELLLTATLIRYQPILHEAMAAHQELFQTDVIERIKSETDGKYETLLIQICESAPPKLKVINGEIEV